MSSQGTGRKPPRSSPSNGSAAGEIQRRPLGRTGVEVSVLGLGGFHLAKGKVQSESIRIVHEAVGAGITFLDNAWEYNDGLSEEWMGQALQGRRDQVFLMTKVCTHTRGKDVVPLNCFDATFRSFELHVLPELVRRGIGAIGMRSLGGTGQMIGQGAVTAGEALRYAMSLPVATTVSGIPSLGVLHQNLGIARGFQPMSPPEMQALRDRCATQAADGRFELYKTTAMFEAKEGREQHGFPAKEEEMVL